MEIILPPKKFMEKIMSVDSEQKIFSSKRYYTPFIKEFYLKRFKLLLGLMKEKNFNHLLDIGYGSGIFLPTLESRTRHLTAIDIHDYTDRVKTMLHEVNCKATIMKGDILNLPFSDNEFDCVSCLSVLEFVENTDKAVFEIHRVSKSGARIIIGAPVSNKLTTFCYGLLGKKDQNTKHSSNHNQIINSIKKQLIVEEIRVLPNFLPLDWALFFVLSATKP